MINGDVNATKEWIEDEFLMRKKMSKYLCAW